MRTYSHTYTHTYMASFCLLFYVAVGNLIKFCIFNADSALRSLALRQVASRIYEFYSYALYNSTVCGVCSDLKRVSKGICPALS